MLPHWGDKSVISDINLSCFLTWYAKAPPSDAIATDALWIVDHRAADPYGLRPRALRPSVVNNASGHVWPARTILCQDRECPRCTTGRGGYNFRWIRPASSGGWTPRYAHAPGLDPQSARRRCYDAWWPYGTRGMLESIGLSVMPVLQSTDL